MGAAEPKFRTASMMLPDWKNARTSGTSCVRARAQTVHVEEAGTHVARRKANQDLTGIFA